MATGWGRQSWGPDVGAGGGSADSTGPVITNVTPAQGVRRGSTQSVQFDVTDDVALRRVFLYANFSVDKASEVVWNGLIFLFPYGLSIRTELIAGRSYRYIISRQGGWPTNDLALTVNAIDSSANEA